MLGLSQKSLKEKIIPMRLIPKRKVTEADQQITKHINVLGDDIANAIVQNNKKITEQLIRAGVLKEEDIEE